MWIPGIGLAALALGAGATGYYAFQLYTQLSPFLSDGTEIGDLALLLMCVTLEEIGIGDYVPEYIREIEREATVKVNNKETLGGIEKRIYDISQKNLKDRTGSSETIGQKPVDTGPGSAVVPGKGKDNVISKLARQTMDRARPGGEEPWDLFNINENKSHKPKLKITLG